MTVNVFPKRLPLFCAARFPIQLLPGADAPEPPSFDTLAPALPASVGATPTSDDDRLRDAMGELTLSRTLTSVPHDMTGLPAYA